MNNIVLMGEIASRPELRETKDGLAQTSFLLRFGSMRAEEPDYQIAVIVFGNTATEVNGQYIPGDRVIIEGRLQMNSTTRQDGLKEKRAEVIARRLHPLSASPSPAPISVAPPVVQQPVVVPPPPTPMVPPPPRASRPVVSPSRPAPVPAPTNDEIPF